MGASDIVLDAQAFLNPEVEVSLDLALVASCFLTARKPGSLGNDQYQGLVAPGEWECLGDTSGSGCVLLNSFLVLKLVHIFGLGLSYYL